MRKAIICILLLTIGMSETIYAQKVPTKENGADSVTNLKRYQKKPLPPRPSKKIKTQINEADTIVPVKIQRRSPSPRSPKKNVKRDEKVKINNERKIRAKPIRNDRSLSANATKKIETKYLRPSITTLFLQPKNADERTVIARFKNLDTDSRFDAHHIPFNDLKSMTDVENYVQAASNPIMAKWWGRDQQGNFNYSLVANRGAYTATDADVITSRGANTSRIEMIGEQLIDKSYILLYEINDLYDMEEYYNRIDRQNRNNKDYKPINRTDKGYKCNYTVYTYKINFNDSVAKEFYTRYWVDQKNQDPKKVLAWADAKFPVSLITSVTKTVSATQSKNPLPFVKNKSMFELLEDIPAAIQGNAFSALNNKIEDFMLKATVFKAYPVLAKLGNKEGLYIDQRFIVYEIEQTPDGNQKINRKGAVRVKKISDNKTVATGESDPSQFYQVIGKRLYPGMFMKSKEDFLTFNIGYQFSNNKAFGGINAGFDLRISQFLKSPGWHLGVDGTWWQMSTVDAGNLSGLVSKDLSGNVWTVNLNLSKEAYFTQRGNVYIRPLIGVGHHWYKFNKVGNKDITDDSQKKDYTWRSWFVPGGIGIGFNITPGASIEFRPGGYWNFAATTGNKKKLKQNSSPKLDEWGFGSIDKGNGGLTGAINLRIKL